MPGRLSCVAIVTALLLAGCGSPPQQPEVGPKEVYVERGRSNLVILQPYPFAPESDARAYAVVRGFDPKTRTGLQLLSAFAEPKPKPEPAQPGAKPAEPAKPGAAPSEPDDGASLLLFPEKIEVRSDGVCYLGHCAYAHDPFAPRSRVIHHLRLLVVNRRSAALIVPLDRVVVTRHTAGPSLEGDTSVAGSGLKLLAGADAQGRKIEELVVGPGKVGQAHLFFQDDRLSSLDVRWQVLEAGPAVGGKDRPTWRFQAGLQRRYTLNEGVLTPLELRVRDGWPLPTKGPGIEVFTEPRVMPLAPSTR